MRTGAGAQAVREQSLRYLAPSAVALAGPRPELTLATSGGRTLAGPAAHPRFFDGFLGHPQQAAAALLTVARVARTRYYLPPGTLAAVLRAADPVVTCNGDRLRFESFSACCGVYARLDLLPGALDGDALDRGTTNVDFNPPMREALARVSGAEPLHLRVGPGDVTVRTIDHEVVERRVPLPDRWLKGFAEVQLAAAGMDLRAELDAVAARRFVRGLPRSGRSRLWAAPAGGGLRLTSRPVPGAVCLAGPDRLRVLEPLLRYARGLAVYGPPVDPAITAAASCWELALPDTRFVLALSPEVARGFSGEGGVLVDLADESIADDADAVGGQLAFEPRIDVPAVAAATGLTDQRVRRALTCLGAAGRVGYDLADSGHFHRELPYRADTLRAMHPRLRDAQALVASGAVRLTATGATVRSGDTDHRVTFGNPDRCTCPWWGRYRGTRGPCKHVSAARMELRG